MLHPRVESGLKDDNKLLRDDNKHLHEKIDSLVAENARLYAQLYSKIHTLHWEGPRGSFRGGTGYVWSAGAPGRPAPPPY